MTKRSELLRRKAEIIEMLNDGIAQSKIEARFDFSQGSVCKFLKYLSVHNELPPIHPRPSKKLLIGRVRRRYPDLKFGVMSGLFDNLDEEVGFWLADQVPRSGSLVELIRAFVVDAYQDEQDQKLGVKHG